MANLSAQNYESRAQVFMSACRDLYLDSQEIRRIWYNMVSPEMSAITPALVGTDPVTQNLKLSYDDLVNGVTLADQVYKFFSNDTLVNSQYIINLERIRFANAGSAFISATTEALATRISSFASRLKNLYDEAQLIKALYWGTEISAVLGHMPAGSIFFGINTNKENLLAALTMVENYRKLLDGDSPSQADYFATVVKWNVI